VTRRDVSGRSHVGKAGLFGAFARAGGMSEREVREVATQRRHQAARRNVTKAIAAAEQKRTIAHLPKKTRTALGKRGRSKMERDELERALARR